MSVFDAHFHLAGDRSSYDLEVSGRNIIFNDVASFQAFLKGPERSENDAITLILAVDADRDFVKGQAAAGAIDAVKIHSRVQRLDVDGWDRIGAALADVPLQMPVIIDAFYYGKDLRHQPSLPAIVHLLDSHPTRPFVIAHCGGYRLLEYFFHLREFENCSYDLSFALQYLADSSLRDDLKKLIRFTDKTKLLFGSDFPYASPNAQLGILQQIGGELQLTRGDMQAICYDNALRLFKKGELAWTGTK